MSLQRGGTYGKKIYKICIFEIKVSIKNYIGEKTK